MTAKPEGPAPDQSLLDAYKDAEGFATLLAHAVDPTAMGHLEGVPLWNHALIILERNSRQNMRPTCGGEAPRATPPPADPVPATAAPSLRESMEALVACGPDVDIPTDDDLKSAAPSQPAKYETPITVTAIWLRRIGTEVQVLAEIEGVWRVAIREYHEGPFSHIAEGNGANTWPIDELTKK